MKNEKKEQLNDELSRLRNGFTALNIAHKKGVLKTAQELLKIQKTQKEMTTDGTGCSAFSVK
jgi:hypothetical protein